MFEGNWFSLRHFTTPGGLTKRARVSFPTARGFTVVRTERSGEEVATPRVLGSFEDALAAYRAELDLLREEGFYEVPGPRVMHRVHEGKRQAFLVRWPTFSTVEWAMVPWDSTDPVPWQVEHKDTLVAALEEFDDRCARAKKLGFVDWQPTWPEGFAELVADGSPFQVHEATSDADPTFVRHRWCSADGHPEIGPEQHRRTDGSFSLLVQIDGEAEGLTTRFDRQGISSIDVMHGGRREGLCVVRSSADDRIEAVRYYAEGVDRFALLRDKDGWLALSSLDQSSEGRIESGLTQHDFGPFALPSGERAIGAGQRMIVVLDGKVFRRRCWLNRLGEMVLDKRYDAAGALVEVTEYDPAGTRTTRTQHREGAPTSRETFHPNGALALREPLDAEGKAHGTVERFLDTGVLVGTRVVEHGEAAPEVDVWPDMRAALAGEPSTAAFHRGCRTFVGAYARDRARALAESLPALVEGTRDWPAEHRPAPAFWLNEIIEGRLPNEALRPIGALRILDIAVDARDGYLCSAALFAERLGRFRAWLEALPPEPTFAVEVLDVSLAAWRSHADSLPNVDRYDTHDLSIDDFDSDLVQQLLQSALALRLRALVVSRAPWSDGDPGNHDRYVDAEARQQGPAIESFDSGPVFLERLAASPCANTLETLIAQNSELREPRKEIRLPSLRTLDVGYAAKQPNALLASLAAGWAPNLEVLLLPTANTIRWARTLEDPAELAAWREDPDHGFFEHDYGCAPHALLLEQSVIDQLFARKGMPKLAEVALGCEANRFPAPAGGPKVSDSGPWTRSFVERGVVPWTSSR